MLEVDKDGEIQWSKLYGTSGFDSITSILDHPSGGFVVSG